MKAKIFSEKAREIRPTIEKAGFQVVEDDPEIVISYGGDGTFLQSEFHHPGLPKLVLRGSEICKICSSYREHAEVLTEVKAGRYTIRSLPKIELEAKGTVLKGLNDVLIHNARPIHAIRYDLSVNQRLSYQNVIGDGIVVATPLGSTGYYKSITNSFFETGLGLAFNNSVEQTDHIILKSESVIAVSILRGPATCYADNQPEGLELQTGDTATIRQSPTETACFIQIPAATGEACHKHIPALM